MGTIRGEEYNINTGKKFTKKRLMLQVEIVIYVMDAKWAYGKQIEEGEKAGRRRKGGREEFRAGIGNTNLIFYFISLHLTAGVHIKLKF